MRDRNNSYIDWRNSIKKIYGQEGLDKVLNFIKDKSNKYNIQNKLNEKDIFLITYANSIYDSKPDLSTTVKYIDKIYPLVNNIHYLPFFSWTSDGGFSVSNYFEIDKRYGQWEDLNKIKNKNFMFDFVANHSSKSNPWFEKFLNNEEGYKDLYVEYDNNFDYSNIIRPRTSSLFHTYRNKKVWSTFSEDQVDLNFRSINLFMKVLEIIDFYVSKGMKTVRLDAIGFIWKESGHSGMHHPYTHELIKIIKSLTYELYGNIVIISEVNVPHEENISYLGDNGNESDLVYNFALPPLLAYSLLSSKVDELQNWMACFETLKEKESFFNFLSSHDGIGMRPVENILTDKQKEIIYDQAKKNGGLFNYKSLPDGTTTIYEINCTYTDILFKEQGSELDYKRYVLAHLFMLFLKGVPAFYINSLMFQRNDIKYATETNTNRNINRHLFSIQEVESIIQKDYFIKYNNLLNKYLEIKVNNKDFDPYSSQETIKDLPESVVGFIRNKNTHLLFNFSDTNKEFKYNDEDISLEPYGLLII